MIQSEALLNYCSPTPVLECDVNRRSVNIKKMPKEFSLPITKKGQVYTSFSY